MKGLKRKRLEHGFSQSLVGAKVGVKRNTICQYENGNRTPNVFILKKLAELFNCSIDELL